MLARRVCDAIKKATDKNSLPNPDELVSLSNPSDMRKLAQS
jgi:hypothetical protein